MGLARTADGDGVRERLERKLARRAGPVLCDGTPLRDLIDLEKREVALRVLDDPEIHRLELERIFAHSWVTVGHESEIPEIGDFVLRSIGEDEVIVTRGPDGEIHGLLNVCAHRGMQLCWAEQGSGGSFKCPYHGWTFDSEGRLLGAPFEKQMYGTWDKSEYGLRKARVALRHGVIFATFSASAPPLDEYLGDIGWYFDHMFGRTPMEALGPPFRSVIHANWKISADNNSGDGYHTPSLHRSLADLGMLGGGNDAKSWALECFDVSTPEGHGLRCVETAQGVFKKDVEDASGFFDGWFLAGNVFPVSGVHSTPFPTPDRSRLLQTADISVMIPRGAGAFEMWRLPLIEKGIPAPAKREMAKKFVVQFTLTQSDDFVGWQIVQGAARGAVARARTMKYNALLGVQKPDDWPGPGLVYAGFSKDDNQWHFWLRWYEMMTREGE